MGIRLAILLLILAFHTTVFAQTSTPKVFHSDRTSAADGDVLIIGNYSTVGVKLTGSGTFTLVFEVKGFNATTWDALQCKKTNDGSESTTASASGSWQCAVAGFGEFRTRLSDCTGCSITSTGYGTTAVLGRSGGGGSGVASSITGSTTLPGTCTINQVYAEEVLGVATLYFCSDGTWQAVGSAEADTLATVTGRGNTSTGNDESNPLEIFGTGGQSTYGTQLYTHSSGEIVVRCITSAGANKCNYYRQIDDTYKGGFKDKDGTVKWEFNGTTGAIDVSTVDVTTANNALTSYKRLSGCGGDLVGVDAESSTAGHIWDKVPSVTAPTATASIGTNQTVGIARFPDSDGDFGIQIKCRLPSNVTIGQVDAILTWVSAGTGNYRPQLFTKCYGDDVAADAAYNSAQAFTVAAGTATRGQIDTLSNVTMTGCSAGNELFLKLIRNRTEASDTGSSTFDVKSLELWATITE